MVVVGGDATAKKATVVGRIVDDVLVAARHIAAMRIPRVVQPTVWKDPEDEVWIPVGELLDRSAPAAKSRREEGKGPCCLLARHGAHRQHDAAFALTVDRRSAIPSPLY